MRYIKFYFSFLVLIGIFISSCSKLQDNITPPETIVSIHGSGVLQKSSADFHGLNVKQNGLASCQICHGVNFSGGSSSVSCVTCHTGITVHNAGITDTTSSNFHGIFIAASNWNLAQCSQCHNNNNNYAGGIASPTCNNCHKNPGGPEACNTCHGNFSNASLISPPRDTKGNTDPKFAGVGAHSIHLTGNTIAQNVPCNECHIVPKNFSDPGHISQSGNAFIAFGGFTNSGLSAALYNYSTNKCSNTYCHGNFAFDKSKSQYADVGFATGSLQITGNNFQPIWNKVDGTQAACGTCHGLPPTGHVYSKLTDCYICHDGVVDASGKIIDKTKHMNGKVDVFDVEY